MSEEIWNQQEKEIIEEIENNQNITTNDIFNWSKRAVKEGTPNLLQYLSNLSQNYFSLPLPILFQKHNDIKEYGFVTYSSILVEACIAINLKNIEYLLSELGEEALNGFLIAFSIERILPNSSKLIELLIDKEVKIFNIIAHVKRWKFPQSLLNSFNNIEQKIVLKNKEEAKAQLELVKKVLNQCEIDVLNETEEMKNSIITLALQSLNFKIIKYFLSLNLIDIKKPIGNRNIALYYTLKSIKCNDKYYEEERKSLFKIINIFGRSRRKNTIKIFILRFRKL